MKLSGDIEKLLVWAYRDELPKQEANPQSAWNAVDRYSMLGTRINNSPWDYEARLPVILGPPHPDSLLIAKRVSELPRPSGALCIHHAIMGTRPNFYAQPIRIHPVRDGSRVRIVGKCEAKNRYSTGSYCPLRYEPTQATIDHARGEYAAWHAGLVQLVRTLRLTEHVACGPEAPPTPWLVDVPKRRVLFSRATLDIAVKSVAKWTQSIGAP